MSSVPYSYSLQIQRSLGQYHVIYNALMQYSVSLSTGLSLFNQSYASKFAVSLYTVLMRNEAKQPILTCLQKSPLSWCNVKTANLSHFCFPLQRSRSAYHAYTNSYIFIVLVTYPPSSYKVQHLYTELEGFLQLDHCLIIPLVIALNLEGCPLKLTIAESNADTQKHLAKMCII